jgi:hypothetical protein
LLGALGAVRVLCDADGCLPARLLPNFFGAIARGEADLAIGSRYLQGGVAHGQPGWRRAWGRFVRAVIRRALVPGIGDTQCGYKAFSAAAAEQIFTCATIDGWAFDLEALMLARRLGLRVREVPIEWRDAGASRVRACRDLPRVLRDALRIRRNVERGLYRLPEPGR